MYDPTLPEVFGYRGEFFFLSNFYPHMNPLIETFQGTSICYPTAEHAYQASKSLRLASRLTVANAPTPGKSKVAGRSLALRLDWDKVHLDVMRHWVREKFAQEHLAQKLIETYPRKLVEANSHGDQYWGTDEFGDGLNWLGELQMEFRLELIER